MRLRKLFSLAIFFACAYPALAHHSRYTADLTGAAESPTNSSLAIGHAVVTVDFDVLTMRVATTFSGLEGTVTSAHIHGPTTEPSEGVADVMTQLPTFAGFPSGVTVGSYEQMFDLTNASSYNPDFITASGGVSQAMNALFMALHDGTAYLNIHTRAYPDGEIRGFLVNVPGDYNDNGVVDAADYVLWRGSEGDTGEGLQADSNNDNVINEADYTEWRRLFGNDRGDGHHHPSGGRAIPEPASMVLTVAGALLLFTGRRRD
jgi:hypothetical protein